MKHLVKLWILVITVLVWQSCNEPFEKPMIKKVEGQYRTKHNVNGSDTVLIKKVISDLDKKGLVLK